MFSLAKLSLMLRSDRSDRTTLVRRGPSEGDLQNVLNFAPPRICLLSDIMLHIGALSALTPPDSDLAAKN